MSSMHSINHRGYSADAPENTLAAYRLSKEMGFSMVECDVRFTSDGYAVLLHDGTIDRTSDGTGKIAEMTLEEARAYDFGGWKSEAYQGEKIPTFEEFISLCKELKLYPYIELKSVTEAQVSVLMDAVNEYGMIEGVTWISFSLETLATVTKAHAKARCGYLVEKINADVLVDAKKLKTGKNEVFLNCYYGAVTKKEIFLCKTAALPLEVWTVNKEETLLGLDPYVSGVTSDCLNAEQLLSDKKGQASAKTDK